MEKRRLGIVLLILSIALLGFIFYTNSNLYGSATEIGCSMEAECEDIQDQINITNIGFGFFGFMFALGFYILFFSKSEEMILKRLDHDKSRMMDDEKFSIILKALDPHEKKVMEAVKEQDGITQSTLRLRTDMSKAKLSYVLQELEKRNLVKRVPKGKTLQVFLKI